MQHVQQTEPGLCLAACVAMVTNCSLEEVVKNCRLLKPEDGIRYLPDNEAAKFMASRFKLFGLRLRWGSAKHIENGTTHIETEIGLRNWPAILSVPSVNFPGSEHAVVWDNERQVVLDPLKTEPASLDDYQVLEWTPVCEL